MEPLFVITGKYDHREDIPSREQVPEFEGRDDLLYLTAERYNFKYDTTSKSFKITTPFYLGYAIDPQRIPTIERDYLADVSDILKLERYLFRPTDQMTREECNTREGRLKLLSWFYGFPFRNADGRIVPDLGKTIPYTNGQDVKENKFDIWEMDPHFLTQKPITTYNYGCMREPLRQDETQTHTFTAPPIFGEYQPDMILAVEQDKEILTREEFQQALVGKFSLSSIGDLMTRYDYCQKMVDRAFATYELFRTEKYDAIASLPINDQRTAIHNYFATWYYYGNRGNTVIKAGGAEVLTYNKPKYVRTNMAKYLGIPSEVLTYSQKTLTVEPLLDAPSADGGPQQQRDKEQKIGYVSKESRQQRTDKGDNLKNIYGDYLGYALGEEDGPKFDMTALEQFVALDTTNRKIYNELLYAITTHPDFKIEEQAARVAEVQTPEDMHELMKDSVFMIEAQPVITGIYGRYRYDLLDDLKERLNKLKPEPFVLYRLVETKNKKGDKILCRVKSYNKNDHPLDKRELIYIGERFKILDVIGYKKGGRGTVYIRVQVNPIHFSNMLDGNGKLTNYDRMTPEYISFNRDIRNDDVITPAVEKLLTREYDRHFPIAQKMVSAEYKKARQAGTEKPDAERRKFIRHRQQTQTINKETFFAAVCKNVGLSSATMTIKQRHDVNTDIEQALQLMVTHNVIIDKFATSPDGKSWIIHFATV